MGNRTTGQTTGNKVTWDQAAHTLTHCATLMRILADHEARIEVARHALNTIQPLAYPAHLGSSGSGSTPDSQTHTPHHHTMGASPEMDREAHTHTKETDQ